MTLAPNNAPVDLFTVTDFLICLVRLDPNVSRALDGYEGENVAARWLSRKRAYEITLRFDADDIAYAIGPPLHDA